MILHPAKLLKTAAVLFCLSLTQSLFAQSSAPIYTIPVVFHILHQGGPENISDAQVLDALAILNKDFQKKNADTITIVPSFTAIAANVQFEFRLAGIDPNGNCTNGIIRHYTSRTNWNVNDYSYFAYSWPANRYLNFYVIRSMNIPGGNAYTFFPGSGVPASADAIVVLHNNVGSIGTGNASTSRWITQKVGHWFNLQHTWGLSPSLPAVCGDDGVADTPPTKGFINCNLANASICTSTIVENVQNFMDGSPCRVMFTNGQKTRMHACITSTINSRNNLSSPTNLVLTGITTSTGNCLPIVEVIASPVGFACEGNTVSLQAYVSNASVTSYSWTAGNGALIANPTGAATTLTIVNTGNTSVTCVVSNTAGAVTANTVVIGLINAANVIATNQESFESGNLPNYWQVINPTTSLTLWQLSNQAGSHGNNSMYVNGETAPGGSEEVLQTPSYDFLNNPGSTFTFKYAYARKSNTHFDVFKVQASKDCGASWKDIYVPGTNQMASGSGETDPVLFIPTPAQWKFYNLSNHPFFQPFLSEKNVLIRFYFKEDTAGNGNRFYLDQVNFENINGVSELAQQIKLNLVPNPAHDRLQLNFTLNQPQTVAYTINDIRGRLIAGEKGMSYETGEQSIQLQLPNALPPGLYFVSLDINGTKAVKKLVVN